MSSFYSSSNATGSSSSLASSSSSGSCSSSSNSLPATSSILGSWHSANPVDISQQFMRVIPKSILAKRIAKARACKSADCIDARTEGRKAPASQVGQTKKEVIEAKFLLNEIEWKKDAVMDEGRRISEGMKQLGL